MEMAPFWPTVTQMVTFDAIILLVFAFSLGLMWRGRRMLRRAGAQTGSVLLLVGIGTLSSLYLYDLFTMLVLPAFIGQKAAMEEMVRLHLWYAWFIHIAGFVLIALGMVSLTRAFAASSDRVAKSEAYFRDLFDAAPVALFEEDWSGVKAGLDRLPAHAIQNVRAYLLTKTDVLEQLAASIRLSNANAAAVRAYDLDNKAALVSIYSGSQHHLGTESMRSAFLSAIESFLAGETLVVSESEDVTVRGRSMHVRTTAKLPETHQGSWQRVLQALEDVTVLKQADARMAYAQKMEALGQLTGGVAHDFNNLLAIMMGHAELLGDRVGFDGDGQKSVEVLMRAIDRGASLTQRLLAYSRQSPLSSQPCDVTSLVAELEDMLRRSLGEAIDIKVKAARDLWPAMIDRHQYENALVNLAINARDAMPDGGTLTIETANIQIGDGIARHFEDLAPGDYVRASVIDTGTGMPVEVLEKACDPFFTTKDVGKGSGLGLSMVYGFAKQSGGHLAISSEIGQGTIVDLYMPRADRAALRKVGENSDFSEPVGTERILLVEDDTEVREVTVSILRSKGYDVVETENGSEAIAVLSAGAWFDLVFTDVVLPGAVSGTEVADEARRLLPGIKVLFATGYAFNSDALDAQATLIAKPYRRADLLRQVRIVLETKSLKGPSHKVSV